MASLREIHSGEPTAVAMREITSNPIFTSDNAVEDESTAQLRDIVIDPIFTPALWALYIFICADVWIGAYTDPNTTEELTLQMVAFCFQLLTFFATAIAFYVLLSETFLIQKALYRRVVKLFKPFFILAPLYFVVFLCRRLYQLALLYSYYPPLALWEQPGYYFLYCAQKIGAMAYWATLMRSTSYLIREPRLFTPASVNMY